MAGNHKERGTNNRLDAGFKTMDNNNLAGHKDKTKGINTQGTNREDETQLARRLGQKLGRKHWRHWIGQRPDKMETKGIKLTRHR